MHRPDIYNPQTDKQPQLSLLMLSMLSRIDNIPSARWEISRNGFTQKSMVQRIEDGTYKRTLYIREFDQALRAKRFSIDESVSIPISGYPSSRRKLSYYPQEGLIILDNYPIETIMNLTGLKPNPNVGINPNEIEDIATETSIRIHFSGPLDSMKILNLAIHDNRNNQLYTQSAA